MQVELSKENEAKIEEYRKLVRAGLPSFNPSVTSLANEGIREYFEDAIELQKKIDKMKFKK